MNKPRHFCIPLTYKPKIEAVFAGTIRQTIRLGRRYKVGDSVTLYEWSGRPRRSKWGRRKDAVLTVVRDVHCDADGVTWSECEFTWWQGNVGNFLAQADGIDPPTGLELKRVLESFHGPFIAPVEAQILRW